MVDILLATYNGAKYLKPQIMSILYQTYTDWVLYIHDDGSTDGTIDIIKEFECNYPNIHYVNDGISHLGPGMNFMHLLNSSKSSFVCFCDQDDIWFDNKLEVMVNAFSDVDMSKPFVVYSQARDFFSERHNYIGRYSYSYKHYTIKDSIFKNGGIQGCASMFNAAMRDFINIKHDYVAMHDHILMLAGIINNGIKYVDTPLFLYRQHFKNTTSHQPQNIKDYLIFYMKNKKIPVIERPYYEGVKSFYKNYNTYLTPAEKNFFQLYFSMPFKSKLVRSFWIIWKRIPQQGSVWLLFFKNLVRENYI